MKLADYYVQRLEAGLQKCAEFNTPLVEYSNSGLARKVNPRWNDGSGQQDAVVLHNVTLFDGEDWSKTTVNIGFAKGIITAVVPASSGLASFGAATILDVEGKHVTPGLVDMHSHHLTIIWPMLQASDDTNEINNDAFGPLTPFVRSLDGIKPYDEATTIIRSGGVTSSLILPGSANIMGGEAYAVKNLLRSGRHEEENVDEMLLEQGVPNPNRRRYMKMACGENPKRVYKHTRYESILILWLGLIVVQDGQCLDLPQAYGTSDRVEGETRCMVSCCSCCSRQ